MAHRTVNTEYAIEVTVLTKITVKIQNAIHRKTSKEPVMGDKYKIKKT